MRIAMFVLALAWAVPVGASEALSLLDHYDAARDNDASFQSSTFAHEASQQEKAIGRAGLLPNLSLSSRVGTLENLDSADSTAAQTDALNSDTTALTLSQPLYDRGAWAIYQQSKARERLGDAQFAAAGQELFERVVDTYFSAARVENDLRLNAQQKMAIEGLARQSRRLYGAGEGAVTDIDEAQARLDLIRAEEIALHSAQKVIMRKLSGQAGGQVDAITSMREQLPDGDLLAGDQDLVFWMLNAEQTSPMLEIKQAAVQVAESTARATGAGHFPTLALASQLAKTDQSSGGQESTQSTSYVGVVLTLPLYAGGGVSASSKRADATLDSTRADYDAGWQTLAEDIEKQYLGVSSGQERAKAMQAAVRSAQRALESAQKGYQAGTRTTTDILDAQQRLFLARRDMLGSKLIMLESYVLLHTRTGQMNRKVLKRVQELY